MGDRTAVESQSNRSRNDRLNVDRTNHEESGFEKTGVENFASLSRLPENLTHMTDPEMTRGVENVADVAEHLVDLNLLSNKSQSNCIYTPSTLSLPKASIHAHLT